MTSCNRCGTEFDNFYNGMHWCTTCGKQFMFDENSLKEKETEEKSEK